MGIRVLAMWNTGKIDLALRSALLGMCAVSGFEVGLVSGNFSPLRRFMGDGTLHGTRILERCARVLVQCLHAAASAGKIEGQYSFVLFFCFYKKYPFVLRY